MGTRSSFETLRKKLQWFWWLAGVAAVLVGSGFIASESLGEFATQEEVDEIIEDVEERHGAHREQLGKRIDNLDERMIEVRIEQGVSAGRQKLIDSRLKFITVQVAEAHTAHDRRVLDERAVQYASDIAAQEQVVQRMENNPRAELGEM